MCPQRFSQTSGGTQRTRLHPPCFPQRHPAATRQRHLRWSSEPLREQKVERVPSGGPSSSPSPLPQSKVPLSILTLPWVDGVQPYIYTQRAQLAGNVSKKGEGRLQHHSPRLPCGRWRVQPVMGDACSSRHRGRVKSCLPNCSTHDLKLAVVGAPRCSALTCNSDLGKLHPPAPALPERHLILKAKAEKHYFHT